MSEDEAVTLAQSGDESAFSFLYTVHHPRVLAFCHRQLRNKEDAEDVTQDIFLLVHRNISKYQGNASFSTWLHRITNNAIATATRKKHVRTVDYGSVPEPSSAADQEFAYEVKQSLGRLKEMEQFSVQAYIEGHSMKDLGASGYFGRAMKKLGKR